MTPAARQSAHGPGESRLVRVVERIAIGIASLVLSIGLILLLSGYFAGRDQAAVSGGTSGPGQAFSDLGHATLSPGQPRPSYNSNPPTSGPHVTEAVVRDGATLNDDQLLQALQLGNVVIVYGTKQPPPGLSQVREHGGATVHVGARRHRRRRDPRPPAGHGGAGGARLDAPAASEQSVRPAARPVRVVLARSRRFGLAGIGLLLGSQVPTRQARGGECGFRHAYGSFRRPGRWRVAESAVVTDPRRRARRKFLRG